MKDLLERLRRIELDAAFLATASPAVLFDLEAALLLALVEVRRHSTQARTDGVLGDTERNPTTHEQGLGE